MSNQKQINPLSQQSKFFIHLFFVLLITYAACTIYSFFIERVPELLPAFEKGYKLTRSFIYTLWLLPIVQTALFLYSFSLIFARLDDANIQDRSTAMAGYLKALFTVLTILFVLNVIALEIILPLQTNKLIKYQTDTAIYNNSIKRAEYGARDNRLHALNLAANHVRHALSIIPESQKALQLLDEISIKQAALGEIPFEQTAADTTGTEASGFEQAIQAAKHAMAGLDFFTAHYRATEALNLAATDSERNSAQQLITESWNKIELGDDSTEQIDRALYEKKRTAYNAFIQGAYLKAYNLFFDARDFFEENYNAKTDRQIAYFIEQTKHKLSEVAYFYEDIEIAPAIVYIPELSFDIKQDTHTLYTLSFDGYGITPPLKNSPDGRSVIFLKNLTLTKYNYANNILYRLHSNYAKLVQSVDPETNTEQLIVQMTLLSSDRSLDDIFPTVEIGQPWVEPPVQKLPLSLEQLVLVTERAHGISSLNIATLHKLRRFADRFGFDKKILLSELITRIGFLLLLFLIELALACIAWKFRFDLENFRLSYALILPLCAVAAIVVIELSYLLLRSLSTLLVQYTGLWSAAILTAAWIVSVILHAVNLYKNAKN